MERLMVGLIIFCDIQLMVAGVISIDELFM